MTAPGSPLQKRLAERIARFGPMTVAEYMAAALTDPEAGYYVVGDPFGAAGDFTTAPEVSQMFGELIGLWCAEVWRQLGRPNPVWLVELGPGRGTLMADALRAARVQPAFRAALRLALVEVSPALRARLAAALEEAAPEVEPIWLDHAGDLPDGPLLLVANEFFDALPVRQIEHALEGWRERLVGLSPDGERLAFAAGPPSQALAALVPAALRQAGPSTLAEICPAGLSLAAWLGARLAAEGEAGGGAALIVDYGYSTPSGRPSLQALRRHRPQDVLAEPGLADLTAHVDFGALIEAATASGARAHGPVAQGAFLTALGIEERAGRLARSATEQQRLAIESALERLTSKAAMGEHFKVLALAQPSLDSLPGFA